MIFSRIFVFAPVLTKTLLKPTEKEVNFERKRNQWEEDYYDTHGHSAPESEDDDVDQSPPHRRQHHNYAPLSDDAYDDFGSPGQSRRGRVIFPLPVCDSLFRFVSITTLFLQARTLGIVTESPPAVPRKSSTKTPVSKVPPRTTGLATSAPLPTPPATQPASARMEEVAAQPTSQPPTQNEVEDADPQSRPPDLCLGENGKALGHYTGITKKLMVQALYLYEAHIIAGNMFPYSNQQVAWPEEIWCCLCEKFVGNDELPIELTEEMSRLVRD